MKSTNLRFDKGAGTQSLPDNNGKMNIVKSEEWIVKSTNSSSLKGEK